MKEPDQFTWKAFGILKVAVVLLRLLVAVRTSGLEPLVFEVKVTPLTPISTEYVPGGSNVTDAPSSTGLPGNAVIVPD